MSIKYKTLSELKELLEKKDISSFELVEETLKNISSSKTNSFITLNEEAALSKAKEFDQGECEGDLAGLPIAQKDLFCTKNLRTTCGSRILENFIPPYNATVVENLSKAGSICVGKTNMDEFAMGSSNETSYFGTVKNPWDLERVPGGSSGGSAAAVAEGLVCAATGTDTGGSIRQPAALCGITGIKPTYGRASRWGMIAFASSLDQAGAFARTAEDCALMLNHICSHDEKDSTSLSKDKENYLENINNDIKGKKIGIVKEFDISNLTKEVQDSFEQSKKIFESLGANFVEVSMPNIKLSVPTYYVVAPAECSSNLSRFDGVKYGYRAENINDLEDLYIKSRSEGFGDEVKRRILIGTYVLSAGFYDAYYKKAQQSRRMIKNDFVKAFSEVDVIMSPTSPSSAFKIGSKTENPIEMYLEDLFTISSNLAGVPAMSIPHGFSNNLPIGLQLIGNYLEESKILNFAHQYQKNTDWHIRNPDFGENS
tara:strand:+ start:7028 stop:8479 length:1452 start_codon:yes stop_codon:yes gene_type:complete